MFTKPYARLEYAEWDIEPRDFPCTCFDGQTKFCSFGEMNDVLRQYERLHIF